MKKRISTLIILVLTVILEILPYGAVCRFMDDGGEPIRKTFSYFDLTPYGYANFGPFITAVLTCVLLALAAISLFAESAKIKTAVKVISVLAFAVSLAPLTVGLYSVMGGVISSLLLSVAVISFLNIKQTR